LKKESCKERSVLPVLLVSPLPIRQEPCHNGHGSEKKNKIEEETVSVARESVLGLGASPLPGSFRRIMLEWFFEVTSLDIPREELLGSNHCERWLGISAHT
jgi:hypothetical protein